MQKSREVTEFGVKSQLAKLLATENIALEHRPGVPTAWFDIKNRQLVLPVWQGISNDLYDMLVVHETGHALDTPLDDWMQAIKDIAAKNYKDPKIAKKAEASIKDFINVVEDARIDKRQKRRYPGSKINYVRGLEELHKRDFFGLIKNKRDINTMTFIDRVNIYFKGGYAMNIQFTKEELGYIKRMEEAETFAEVIDIVNDIYQYARSQNQFMQQTTTSKLIIEDAEDGDNEGGDWEDFDINDYDEIEDRRKNKGQGKSKKDEDKKKEDDGKGGTTQKSEEGDEEDSKSGDEGDGEGDDGDEQDGKKSGGAGDKAKAQKNEDGDDKSEEKQVADSKKKDSDKTDKGEQDSAQKGGKAPLVAQEKFDQSGGVPDDFIPESRTEEAAAKSLEQIVMNTDANYIYVRTPEFILKNVIDDYKVVLPKMEKALSRTATSTQTQHRTDLMNWRKSENETISFMVKEFEMRKAADTHSRIKISKTGVIDTNKLYNHKLKDDIFRRMATIPEGKNHGFVMFLDWSGSMTPNIRATLKQLLALCFFCKRVGVPFDIYTFRNKCYEDGYKGHIRTIDNSLNMGEFKLRNILSSRMSNMEFNKAVDLMWLTTAPIATGCDPMDSTPLNQAILCAHDIVNKFQKKHRVQIVNTVFFTDGCSDGITGIINEKHLPRKAGGNKYFLRDHVTGRNYVLPDNPNRMGADLTRLFLKMLKDRTDSNLIGFYLLGGGLRYAASAVNDPSVLTKKDNEDFYNNNGFLNVECGGYDDYFIISAERIKNTNNVMAVNQTQTQEEMAKQFAEFNKRKSVNRVLLTQLVDRISTTPKEDKEKLRLQRKKSA